MMFMDRFNGVNWFDAFIVNPMRSGRMSLPVPKRRASSATILIFLALAALAANLPASTALAQTTEEGQDQTQNQDDQETDNLFGDPSDEELENLFGQPDGERLGEGFGDSGRENGADQRPADDQMVFPTGPGDENELVALELKGVTIQDLAMMIAEWSGKPVWIDPKIADQKITLINGKPVTKHEAFDLLGIAIFEQKLALVDRNSYLAVISLSDIPFGDAPIIGPDQDVLDMTNRGMIAVKVYQLKHGRASNIIESLRRDGELLPLQYAKFGYDDASNQIIVMYNIGTLQRIQRMINALDVEGVPLQIDTFYLKHRSAEDVAQIIVDLFSADENQEGTLFGPPDRRRGGGRFGQQPNQTSGVTTTNQLRVTFDKQTNSITVRAEEAVIDQIRTMINNRLDVPIVHGEILKYDLENSDVIQVRDMLRELFSPADTQVGTIETSFFGDNRGRAAFRGSSQGSEEGVKGLHPFAGQYTFEADEAKNRLFVVAQSTEAAKYMEQFLKTIDQPSPANAPILIELKYANAERLSEQLNALFQETGGGQTILGGEQGLTQGNMDSPFAQGSSNTGGTQDTPEAQDINFWWQSGRPNEDERPISNLIAQMRIVPILRQNALLILARPEHRASIKEMIDQLDRPGRQVLILATVAEASEEVVAELGFRWASDRGIVDSSNPDNSLVGIGNIEASKNNLFPDLFDMSVLSLNVDLTAVLSLLQEDTDSSILSDPRIFTSDNEEAVFFDGQDIPFITDSQVTDTGQTINSFDYRAVGIRLAVRPHITVEGNVDMQVNLELSSILPGQTLFGGFIVDRRETSSRVTIRDQQTIVISGILRSEDSEIVRKVPFLGDIPIIGQIFFRSKDRTRKKTELLAFITPVIVDNPDRSDQVFQENRDWLQEKFPPENREFGGPPIVNDPLRPGEK